MSQKSITELNINSITLSNSNYAGLTGFTAQSSTLYTSNTGVLLVNGVPISGGGGSAVNAIDAGVGILVTEDPTGTFTIDNDGVLEVTAGDGISIADSGNGSFEITNTVNPADFLTTTSAAATYQTQASMLNYSTTVQADALYQPVGAYLTASSLNPYSTTVQADALYQPVGAYLTASSLDPYSTTATANGLYAPINSGVTSIVAGTGISISPTTGLGTVTVTSDMVASNYSTTTEANALYQPIGNAFLTEGTANTLYYPIGKIYWFIGDANLGNVTPQTTETFQINVPFYSLSTSAILITVNSGTAITSIVGQAYFVSSTQSPVNTTIQVSFYNSSTTATVSSGTFYTVLIINV